MNTLINKIKLYNDIGVCAVKASSKVLLCKSEGFEHLKRYVASYYPTDVSEDIIFGRAIITGLYGDSIDPRHAEILASNTKLYKKGEIESNPYYANIKLDECTCGKFNVVQFTHDLYSLNVSGISLNDEYVFSAVPHLYGFEYEFKYPCLREGNNVWMSVSPNEIETIQPHIDECTGKVLTLGCGIGYFAYMASLKDDVTEITIVERSDDVIKLFTEKILPQFSNKDKIHIIKADATEYLSTLEDGVYDYCFADLWDGSHDSATYLKTKVIGNKFTEMKMSYWIESSIVLNVVRRVTAKLQMIRDLRIDAAACYRGDIVDRLVRKASHLNGKDLHDFFKTKKFMKTLNSIK